MLPTPELVPHQQHRRALGEQQCGQEIELLAAAQGDDRGVVGRTLDAVIGAEIVVVAIAVVLAIGFVVAPGIADQVGESEAVVAGDKVDADKGLRPAAS